MGTVKETEFINDISDVKTGDISLTDSYLANALEKEVKYLLSFDCDKWLAGFRETAGLDMKGATRYEGWESMLIAGHSFGHYISACSFAYNSPDVSSEDKKKLFEIIKYIIDGLKECQENSKSNPGFIFCAVILDKDNLEKQFDNVEIGKTHLITEAWVPWYTVHKILQGIVDVYINTGYGPALSVACGLGDWTYNRASGWSEELRKKVLSTEYGGMNDCLYDLYKVSGNEKYAVAAHFFDEEDLFEKVKTEGKNVLTNRHANTTIPKFVGALKRYYYLNGREIGGKKVDAKVYLEYCEKFFKMVRDNHTYITGGNSEWEHFGEDKILDAERTNANNETCNTYNMLKLAKLLFMITGDVQYADFYENTYINSILSSQNPETGMTMYFQPMATGYFKVYGEPFNKFWCCTGTGMENFTRLGDAIYFRKDENIFVNMYLSSVLSSDSFSLTQESEVLYGGNTIFTIRTEKESISLILRFRIPDWCTGRMTVNCNGEETDYVTVGGYACLSGSFRNGDRIMVTVPMGVKVYPLPDNTMSVGLKYGPIVLSAKLGTENMKTTTTGVNVTIPENKEVESEYIILPEGMTRDAFVACPGELFTMDENMNFSLRDKELVFTPHFSKYKERYGIYWYYCTQEEYDRLQNADRHIEDTVIDTVQPGYGQYESDELHKLDEVNTVSVTNDGTCRYAKEGGYFAYNMAVKTDRQNYLSFTLKKADNGKTLKISSKERILFSDKLDYCGDEDSYEFRMPIPSDIFPSIQHVEANGEEYDVLNFCFSGVEGKESARVCDFIYTLISE